MLSVTVILNIKNRKFFWGVCRRKQCFTCACSILGELRSVPHVSLVSHQPRGLLSSLGQTGLVVSKQLSIFLSPGSPWVARQGAFWAASPSPGLTPPSLCWERPAFGWLGCPPPPWLEPESRHFHPNPSHVRSTVTAATPESIPKPYRLRRNNQIGNFLALLFYTLNPR